MSATLNQYAAIIQKLIQKQNFFEKALLNSRVKKSIDYTRNYRPDIRCPLEPGDIILIEPEASFGAYEIRTDQMPSVITYQKLSLLAPNYATSLPALTTSPGTQITQMTSLDLPIEQIALYKIVPEDFGYTIQFNQPNAITRFSNKLGSWNMAGADMTHGYQYPALTPELMTFEDRTPITMRATSTDPNTPSNYFVRVGVYGYQFLIKKMRQSDFIRRGDPRIVMTIWVGAPYK